MYTCEHAAHSSRTAGVSRELQVCHSCTRQSRQTSCLLTRAASIAASDPSLPDVTLSPHPLILDRGGAGLDEVVAPSACGLPDAFHACRLVVTFPLRSYTTSSVATKHRACTDRGGSSQQSAAGSARVLSQAADAVGVKQTRASYIPCRSRAVAQVDCFVVLDPPKLTQRPRLDFSAPHSRHLTRSGSGVPRGGWNAPACWQQQQERGRQICKQFPPCNEHFEPVPPALPSHSSAACSGPWSARRPAQQMDVRSNVYSVAAGHTAAMPAGSAAVMSRQLQCAVEQGAGRGPDARRGEQSERA